MQTDPDPAKPFETGMGPLEVALFHDLGGCPGDVAKLARAISIMGYRVRVPALAGHGEAPQGWLEDAGQAVTTDPKAKIAVAGVGFGAALALAAASQVPVRAALLIEPFATIAAPKDPLAQAANALWADLSKRLGAVKLHLTIVRVGDPQPPNAEPLFPLLRSAMKSPPLWVPTRAAALALEPDPTLDRAINGLRMGLSVDRHVGPPR